MFPSESQIRAQREKANRAKLSAVQARVGLNRSVRALAASPAGLTTGFILGMGVGWFLNSRPAPRSGRGYRLPSISFLLPLLQIIHSQLKDGT